MSIRPHPRPMPSIPTGGMNGWLWVLVAVAAVVFVVMLAAVVR